jgi:hypothetical protein
VETSLPQSLMLEMRGGKLEAVTKKIPYLLRKANLPGEGYQLLGQQLNGDLRSNENFDGPVFRMIRNGDQLQHGAAVTLPSRVQVSGFQQFAHAGRPLIANLNANDKLEVLDPAGTVIWESSDYFGGSESSFERPEATQGAGTRYVFIKQRIEPGPEGTLLIPVNEGNRVVSAFRTFSSSHLKAVTYDGYSLSERWRTKPQGGYLADFRMADADNDGAPEIVMLVMFSRGSTLKGGYGNAALLIYEMQ